MPYSYDLKDIECFMQVARSGSMTKAALHSNVPKATLSLRIRNLEDSLSVALFTRTQKGMVLTDAGKEYHAHCTEIFESCDAAASAAQRAHSTVDGKLRIAASSEFGTSIIGAATYYMAKSHPGIDFELQMYSDDKIIAGQRDFDCMFYVGSPPDSDLIGRRLGEVSYGLYASPEFIQQFKMPTTPEELASLEGVVYVRSGIPEKWLLKKEGKSVEVECYPRFTANEYWMAKYFAVEGLSIAYLPDFFVHYEVEFGALVPVLPQWRSESIPVFALYHTHRHGNSRISMLVDTLCSRFDEFVRHPGYSLIKNASDDMPGD